MKKILTIVLVVIMCFSLAVPAFAADYKDTANHANREAIDVIDTLGVIEGYPDGRFGPEDNLTRAQMTAMLTRAVIPTHIAAYKEIKFDDVPHSHWAYDYITTAYSYGFVNGYGGNKFGPDDYVTYPQLAAILLNILGYDATSLSWPNGVINCARDLRMFDNIKYYYTTNELCTRAGAAQMIYNALNATAVIRMGNFYYENESTLLEMMGFSEVEPTEVNGCYMRTFLKDKKYYVSNTCVSTTYEGVMINPWEVRIDHKNYKIDWREVTLYINEELVNRRHNALAAGDRVTVIMGNDGTIYSVSHTEALTFAPGDELPAEVAFAIARDRDYNPYTSTITYINPHKYYISNTYVFDYVINSYTIHGYHYIILANDRSYYYEGFEDIEAGQWIIIYFDYNGEISGYHTFSEEEPPVEEEPEPEPVEDPEPEPEQEPDEGED